MNFKKSNLGTRCSCAKYQKEKKYNLQISCQISIRKEKDIFIILGNENLKSYKTIVFYPEV